jgi:hypothetical protein
MRGILQNASPRRPLATARKFRNTEVGERTGTKAVSVSGTGAFLLNEALVGIMTGRPHEGMTLKTGDRHGLVVPPHAIQRMGLAQVGKN